MIRIIRNDRELELFPDTTLTLEWNNWLFSDDEKLPGSFSYEVRFPLSPSNLIFLGFSDLPEQAYNSLSVVVQLSVAINLRCLFDFDVENEIGTGYLKFESAEVNQKIRNKKLSDAIFAEFRVANFNTSSLIVAARLEEIAQAPVGTYPVVFAPIYNPDFVEKDFSFTNDEATTVAREIYTHRAETYINPYGTRPDGTAGFLLNESTSLTLPPSTTFTGRFFGRFLVPFPFLVPVLKELVKWLGFQIEGTWIDDPDVKTRVFYNTYALSSMGIPTLLPMRVKIAEHLPNMTVGEFLKAIRKYFTLSFEWKNPPGIVRINSLANILDTETTTDWSSYQTTTARKLNRPDNQGYAVNIAEDSSDKLYKELKFNPKYTLGEGRQNYEVPIGTLPMWRDQNPYGGARWLVPQALQQGNVRDKIYQRSGAYTTSSPAAHEWGLRLLSYRGMQPDAAGKLYPMLTSGVYNVQNKRIGNSCDDSRQRLSVYQQHIRRYLTLTDATRPMQQQLLLPIAELQHFGFDRLLGLRGMNRVWMRHLVSKLVIELPDAGGFVKAKAYTYPLLPGKYGPITTETVPWLETIETNRRSQDTAPGQNAAFVADIQVKAWTTPEKVAVANVSGLSVFYTITTYTTTNGTTEVTSKEYSFVMTGSEAIIYVSLAVVEFPAGGSIYRILTLSENTEYLIIFS